MFYEITLLVTGVVQGVGFRPFCAKLAQSLQLGGSVKNTSDGVVITLRGDASVLDSYRIRLESEKPGVAYIQSIDIKTKKALNDPPSSVFTIQRSERHERQRVLIPPDIATCDDCIKEMNTPGNRRYRYPFINCTNCGPRYSIIQELPYDRPGTTMAPFIMCEKCNSEYTNSQNRRFHAQPNACDVCGPHIWLEDKGGHKIAEKETALGQCVKILQRGAIVAIKGLGGFHLACDPFNDTAVGNLRDRKGRPHKPFALMVPDIEHARKLVEVSSCAEKLLSSSRRPIVLCPILKGKQILSSKVAPGQGSLGLMLPYTPLHHLLLQNFGALIMTSANMSDTPIISQNEEATALLSHIADAFLMHNRDIYMRIDDSVVAACGDQHIIMRRARGFVPTPIMIKHQMPMILAAGAEMKSTYALTQENLIFPGQYLGDLKQIKTIEFYKQSLHHFLRLYNLHPHFLTHDMHPQYISTQIARETIDDLKDSLAVQHHHAHFAACLAENGYEDKAIGIILDGTGYGPDHTIWGGEFFVGDSSSYIRVGHLLPARLPGGERAIHEPWRYALSLMSQSMDKDKAIEFAIHLWPDRETQILQLLNVLSQSPVTTSCGRLFDAAAALTGIREKISYDGQAAMELEAIARGHENAPFSLLEEDGKLILDWRPCIQWLLKKIPAPLAAAGFHNGLAATLVETASRLSRQYGIKHVALSGGVWQNRLLFSQTVELLTRSDLIPLTHRLLSPNDECVSVGQAVIGARHWAS